MRRLGIHSFVWTNGQTQEGLEMALDKAAEHGYRMIEFAYLRPEKFDLDQRIAHRGVRQQQGLATDFLSIHDDGDADGLGILGHCSCLAHPGGKGVRMVSLTA